jgi:hypothetical protein
MAEKLPEWEQAEKQVTCGKCGASFIPYGTLKHNECPHCGMPLRGRPPAANPKRRRLGLLLLAAGIILLVLGGILVSMRAR